MTHPMLRPQYGYGRIWMDGWCYSYLSGVIYAADSSGELRQLAHG